VSSSLVFNDGRFKLGGDDDFWPSSVFFSAEMTLSRKELSPAAPETGGIDVDLGFGLSGPT
jgi:hypothetical protein